MKRASSIIPKITEAGIKTLRYFLYGVTKYGKSKNIDTSAYLGIEENVPVRVGTSKVQIEKNQ
jgi:hypothetical protein